jgi:hypothetical protein
MDYLNKFGALFFDETGIYLLILVSLCVLLSFFLNKKTWMIIFQFILIILFIVSKVIFSWNGEYAVVLPIILGTSILGVYSIYTILKSLITNAKIKK